MVLLALLVLVVALVLFVVSAVRTKPWSLVDWGLAFLTLGIILTFTLTGKPVHF